MGRIFSHLPIALDISNHSVRAAQFVDTRKGQVIAGLSCRRFDEDADTLVNRPDGLAAVIRNVVRGGGFKGKRLVIHLPLQHMFSFPVSFQIAKQESIDEAIMREAQEVLPFPIEEAVLDCASVREVPGSRPKTHRAILVTVRRDAAARYIRAVQWAGFVPEAIDSGTSALIRLHQRLHEMGEQPVIFCNMGEKQTMLSVVTGDSILVKHQVEWGTRALREKVAGNLDFAKDLASAERLLEKHGVTHETEGDKAQNSKGDKPEGHEDDRIRRIVYQLAAPHLERLVYEFHTIIGYVRSELSSTAFAKIYVYGLGGGIGGIESYISSRINIPTECVNPLDTIPLPFVDEGLSRAEGTAYALSLGLALRKLAWL